MVASNRPGCSWLIIVPNWLKQYRIDSSRIAATTFIRNFMLAPFHVRVGWAFGLPVSAGSWGVLMVKVVFGADVGKPICLR